MLRANVLILTLMISLSGSSQKNYAGLVERYMDAYSSVYDFNGAVLVAQKGKIIYSKAKGLANREWKIPNSTDTKFRIASLTKQFTAAAILQLEEAGKLSSEDKLSRYIPDFPKADSITLHMLLNHTSGIAEQADNPDLFDLNPNKPIAEIRDTLINTFRHLPFYFSPGTFWRYSNSNYILLGYILEKVSGQTYRDYLYNNLFLKAGMKNTDILKHDSIVASMADGYIKDSGEYKKGMIIPVNTAFSAGGIFSTLTDLYHWNVALNSGKIISKKSLEKMNKPNHEDRGAGYGVFIDMIFDHPAIFHSGNHPGFSSFMIYYPEDDINIVVLANRETNLDFFPRGIAGILFDKEVVSPYKHNRISLPAGSLQKYTGKFEGYYPFEVIEKDNKLFLRIYRDIELIPESVTKFFVDEQDVDIQVEYILDKNKQVTGLNFIEGGIKTRTTKK